MIVGKFANWTLFRNVFVIWWFYDIFDLFIKISLLNVGPFYIICSLNGEGFSREIK